MMSDLVAYFGFGSLVNKHTLRTSYQDIIPARLKGWRRHWQNYEDQSGKTMSLLSIHRDESSIIDGMIVIDLLENLPAVDEREAGYQRHNLTKRDLELLEPVNLPDNIFVYVADESKGTSEDNPLHQSYLDAVLQGFRNEYGDEGVHRFMDTTIGFRRRLIQDRDFPNYPRSVTLIESEMKLFDEALKNAGVLLG